MENENNFIKSRQNSNMQDSFIYNNNVNLDYNTRYNIKNNISGFLPPPNPLLDRKNIPVSSPKFGRNINYV